MKGEVKEFTESFDPVEDDQIVDHIGQAQDQTDDGQNDPGQHKAGLGLKKINQNYKVFSCPEKLIR